MLNKRKCIKTLIVASVSTILLYSNTAMAASPILKTGSAGSDISKLQEQLKTLGFYKYSKITGYYGDITKNAVFSFQESKGLNPDGIAGPDTFTALGITYADNKTGVSRGKSVEMIHWSQVDKLFRRKSTARVTDVDTGKSFMVYRLGGTLHADVEPLTAKDTAIMKEIYGGSWSWDRRAIIVEIDGKRIAASMNGMPHGDQNIYNNNFDGQFCIHFLGSKLHISDKVDETHQAMVRKAANAR